MKKITFLLFALLISFIGYSQFPTPGTESFENTLGPTVPIATSLASPWDLGTGATGNQWAAFDVAPATATQVRWDRAITNFYAGTQAAFINRRQNGGAGLTSEDYLATPLITVPASGQLTFYTRTGFNTATDVNYLIKVNTNTTAGSQTTPANYTTTLQTWNNANPLVATYNIYELKTVDLSAYAGQQVYLAFVRVFTQPTAALNGNSWYVDDVKIVQQCTAPMGLFATGITYNSANLNWSNPSGSSSWEIEIVPATATPTGVGTIYSGTLPYVATGLNPLTNYNFYVRSKCTDSDSAWVGPFNFITTTAPPVCGGNFVDQGGVSGNYANNANYSTTICPTNLGEQVTVTFTSFNTQLNADILKVYNGNGTTGALLGTYSGTTIPGPITSSTPDGCLTFVFTSNATITSAGWLANVTCAPAPPCQKPILLIAPTATVLYNSVKLAWTQPANPDGTIASVWEVIALPCGSPAPTATATGVIGAPTNPFVVTGLSPLTCYDFYVRAVCGPTTSSSWSGPTTATTPIAPPICGGNFVDPGGVTGNYANNVTATTGTTIIQPVTPGDYVTVTFVSFNTELNNDVLKVYSGNGTGGVLLGTFSGTTIPPAITSASPDGSLTFVFTSNATITSAGWLANVTCSPITSVNQPDSQVVCNGTVAEEINFTTNNQTGTTTYNWLNNNPNIGLSSSGTGDILPFTAINNGNTPQVATIIVTPTYTNSVTSYTGPSKTFTITVNPNGQVNPISSQVICGGINTSLNFTTINTGGVTDYYWTNSNSSIGLFASGTGPIPSFTAINNGNSIIESTVIVSPIFNNIGVSCSGPSTTFTITVNPAAQVNPIPSQVLCNGTSTSTINFTSNNQAGTTTYNWFNNNTNIGLASSGTGGIPSFIAINNSTNPIVASITVIPDNTVTNTFCDGIPITFTITVNPTPQLNQIAPQVYCNGDTAFINLSTFNNGGTTTYTWTNTNPSIGLMSGTGIAIPTFIATNNGNTPNVSTIVVTPMHIIGGVSCVGNNTLFTITVNPSGQVNSIPSQVVCSGSPVSVDFTTITTGGTTTYAWTNSNPSIGLLATGTGAIPSFIAINTGISSIESVITVTPTFTNAGVSCFGNPTTFTITVNPTPCDPLTTGFHLNAFLDLNTNGMQDVGENNFPFGQFVYQVNNQVHNVATLSGIYDLLESNPNNIYTISYFVNPFLSPYFVASPSTYSNVSIVPNGGLITYNFPITLNLLTDLGITNIPFGQPVPGFNFHHLILYTNNNALASASRTINFTKDPAIAMVSTSEPSAVLNSNGFSYNFSNLNPFETRSILATMYTPTIPFVNLGQLVFTSATIAPSVGIDLIPFNNVSSTYQFIIGSFDPNDIMESHGKDIVYSDFTSQDYLYYTIRFENTGNGNAINVQVDNTLDSQLDETTLEMVSSSNDYIMDRSGNNVNWKFANIQLPPSVPETTIGKGYIMYKIKPKPGYAIGDIIPNSANIYFDFNPAIVTNTFNTEFVSALGFQNFETDEFIIFPNPTSEKININLKNKSEGIALVQIFDQLGRLVDKQIYSNSKSSETIQLNNLSQGIYYLEVTTDNNQLGRKKIIIK